MSESRYCELPSTSVEGSNPTAGSKFAICLRDDVTIKTSGEPQTPVRLVYLLPRRTRLGIRTPFHGDGLRELDLPLDHPAGWSSG